MTNRSEADWLADVRAAEGAGEFFRAHDLARRGLLEHPDSLRLQHRAVLALARSGATRHARQLFDSLGLHGRHEAGLRELDARLTKDLALAEAEGPSRVAALRAAADKYAAIYGDSRHYYPGINVANLLLLAGEPEQAATVAGELIGRLDPAAEPTSEDRFWAAASLVEAHVIRGDLESAREALATAGAVADCDLAMRATAARSIRNAARAKGVTLDWLEPLSAPTVIHYAGHMIAPPGVQGRFPASVEAEVAAQIAAALEAQRVGFGYGSLACGADILFAEALLARGAQLHVVLPFRLDDFIEVSVRPGGDAWVERLHRCLAAAHSVRYATDDARLGDDTLFSYSSRIAMGLAVLAARHLCTSVEQIAVWDGTPARGHAGTAVDVEVWRDSGRGQHIIALPAAPVIAAATGIDASESGSRRRARAMLFGDFAGFSAVPDRELPSFVEGVLGTIARAVDRHRGTLLSSNTWGDGLFLVFRRTREAAECALDLQAAMQSIDSRQLGLSRPVSLRLGGHLGPVFETEDPLLRKSNFFGTHVSLAARIEPVTPPGLVYVTETFAAALELEHSSEFSCDYVGLTAAAKGYGTLRMFTLRRRGDAADGPLHGLAV